MVREREMRGPNEDGFGNGMDMGLERRCQDLSRRVVQDRKGRWSLGKMLLICFLVDFVLPFPVK